MGISSGPFIALLSPLMAQLFGLTRIAQAMGTMFPMTVPFMFLSSVIMGAIKDLTGDFLWAYLFSTICFFAAALGMLNTKRLHRARLAEAAQEAAAAKARAPAEEDPELGQNQVVVVVPEPSDSKEDSSEEDPRSPLNKNKNKSTAAEAPKHMGA